MADAKGFTASDYRAAYQRLGSYAAVGREFGVNESTVRRSLKAMDPALQASMDAIGTGMVPSMAWIKTKGTKDQPGYSVMLKPAVDDADPLDRIREAFTDLPAALPSPAPLYADDDLLTLYPIADAHVGMLAWGDETGEGYNTRKACDRLRSWVGQCVASSPLSGTGVILVASDLLHADDQPVRRQNRGTSSMWIRGTFARLKWLSLYSLPALTSQQKSTLVWWCGFSLAIIIWRAPTEWSSLNANTLSASGLFSRKPLGLVAGSSGRCAA